jgi:DNA replication protein DnaC
MKTLQESIREAQEGGQLPTANKLDYEITKPDYWAERQVSVGQESKNCDKCDGKGVVKYDVPLDHPHFGKLFPCPENCEAVSSNRNRRAAVMIEKLRYKAGSEITGLYRHHPDDRAKAGQKRSLSLTSLRGFGEASQKTAWELCNQFAETAPNVSIAHNGMAKNSLVLYGDKGFGKTLLASAVVNTLEAKGVPVFGARLFDIVKRVNSVYEKTRAANTGYDDRPEFTSSEILAAFASFPVLVIDEFELNNVTDSRMDIVEELINARYVAGLSTLITTNLDQAGIRNKWNARIADRIIDSYWFFKVAGVKLRDDMQGSEIK